MRPTLETRETTAALASLCSRELGHQVLLVAVSRRIRPDELQACQRNDTRLVEIKLGYEALALVRNAALGPFDVSRRDLYLAVARRTSASVDPQQLIPNPYVTWAEINPALGSHVIRLIGPPIRPANPDGLAAQLLEAGCEDRFEERREEVCRTVRNDGAYVAIEGDHPRALTQVMVDLGTIALLPWPRVTGHADELVVATVEGVKPTAETIASGAYPASRAVYAYVRKPGTLRLPIQERFIAELVSEATLGPHGHFAMHDFVPLTEAELRAVRATAVELKELQ